MTIIKTEDLNLLGKGGQKLVYDHPKDDDKVIKIIMSKHATVTGGRATQNHIRSNRHQGVYRPFRREMIQYLQLCKTHYQENRYTFPIETVYGFMGTDQGLALVTEKIVSPLGVPLAVGSMGTNGMIKEKKVRDALDRFFDDCCDLHIVFGEVNIGGIMYTETRQGRPEFVLVDGIGEKLIIPFRAMSKTVNTRNIRKVEQKIKGLVGY